MTELQTLRDENAQLRALVGELQKDAERYLWLRDHCHHNLCADRDWPHAVITLQWTDPDGRRYNQFHPDKNGPGVGLIALDAALDHVVAIDAAMGAGGEQ